MFFCIFFVFVILADPEDASVDNVDLDDDNIDDVVKVRNKGRLKRVLMGVLEKIFAHGAVRYLTASCPDEPDYVMLVIVHFFRVGCAVLTLVTRL